MSKQVIARLCALLFTLIVSLTASSSAFGSVTIVIQNADPPNVGFNDTTPVAAVGGNSGTTLGQQRLNAFQFAAGIWGATLNSGPTIVIRASWVAQPCTADQGSLGSAGTTSIQHDFSGAPFPGTWYGIALANKLSGTDLNGSTAEIDAQFNINVGKTGCLQNNPWYLGLDNNHGVGTDLVTVLLHEFAHGLGFETFTDPATGAQASGLPSVYDRFVFDDSTGKNWVQMTSAERVASAINTGNLVWTGPQVSADVPNVLGGTPRLRVNSPPSIARNYQVGTADFGPALFSPGITGNVVQASPADGCSALANAGSISGKIALIDRGTCTFVTKVKNAQNAGATGVIVANNVVDGLQGMGGTDATISIPSVLISLADGNSIKSQLVASPNATLFLDPSAFSGADQFGRALLFAPNPVQGGSSVSHWDTTAFPNQLMEPDISDDLTHSVTPPQDLTSSLLRDVGWSGAAVAAASVQFSQPSFSVTEGTSTLSVQVTRTGDTTGVSTVDYATSDTAGANPCSAVTGIASSRCDYITSLGTLQFAAGDTTKTISIPIIDDVYADGNESFTITLTNPTGATLGTPAIATLTINDNRTVNGTSNPIDQVGFFVREHYIDFLNREPDTAGLNFWMNEITVCGSDPACTDVKRINVSASFFLSIEFQETGYLVYRFYKSGFGNLSGAPVPVSFNQFLRDTQQIGQGVQVGVGNWQTQLETNKQAFALSFVQRGQFLTAFPGSLTADQFVTQLATNAGIVLSSTDKANLVAVLGSTPADVTKRASVLRSVAENADLKAAEFNKAFVLMQYFGYLRRNPNDAPDSDFAGFNFWLGKLNQFNGNFINAEMVKAFITSIEYRQRFGP
jgi:hypothetical protein